ncbi:MAG TPA: FKBP-type peptidyl-prolyl cis-trans isomerase [Propionibacteriaceae bacterium]|nr:FKBP-type peptidyl-prolyl cis-trans isomerase [Propionibacteriaceae bacterium]
MPSSPVRFAVVLGLASSLLLLFGCSKEEPAADAASPAPSATPTAATPSASKTPTPKPKQVKASDNFDKVTVTGGYGKEPKVKVDTPWAIDKTRTKVLDASNGPVVGEGQSVEVNYYGVNGRTGKKFDDSFSRGQPVAFSLAQVVPGFSKGLVGQRKGSRVLIAMPGKDGYDPMGGNPQAGIEVGDTLIFVVDLVDVQLAGPEGNAVQPKAGLPTVTDKGGRPEITIPESDPPSSLEVQPLIKGKGKKIGANDTLTFNYSWVRWSDGKVLEESYSGKPASTPLSGLLPGMVKGLEGQTVGSRVLLVIPPSDGYPDGNATPSIKPGETLVMVVDLLFTQSQ